MPWGAGGIRAQHVLDKKIENSMFNIYLSPVISADPGCAQYNSPS